MRAAGAMASDCSGVERVGSVPNLDCDCWRLSQPLTQDDQLPDHVCQETMMASVEAAAREGVIVPMPDVWPVQIGRRRLGLVIRQWAQEEPSATLANLLEASPDWQQTLQSMALYFRRWRELHPDAEVAGWIGGSVCRAKLTSELDRNRLSATPATVRHLRAVLAGVSEPLPARGVLISTKVYVQFHPTLGILHDPSPDFSVSGATEYVTGPLLAQAQQLIVTHRDWLRGFGQLPMSKRHSPWKQCSKPLTALLLEQLKMSSPTNLYHNSRFYFRLPGPRLR
jgi:hypothetical protein